MDNNEKYRLNEMNLQAYRLMFIPLEAILLVIGILIQDQPRFLFIFFMTFGLYSIWGLWFPIVRSRQRVVDYFKFQSLAKHVSEDLPDLESYVHDKDVRRQVNEELGISANWRKTRRKLDFILPVLYTLSWIFLFIYKI
ncbi:hypothetical protein JR338_03350 [Chloroflexota bacterium]|nr:hypothetical protein JR338_03350 [Chloroflexota bacterium]